MTIPKRAFCYTRVSTDQQNTKAQEAELKDYVQRRGWVLKNIYTDKISGMKDSFPFAIPRLLWTASFLFCSPGFNWGGVRLLFSAARTP
jgi:hypothetical protein